MKTALYAKHLALGAKMVDFNGWEMPLHYQHGIVHEHLLVRNQVGLFDVSHMGLLSIHGLQAEAFLDFMSTQAILGKVNGAVIYTVLCSRDGGAVDDVLVFRENSQQFFVITNASNRQKDWSHLQEYAPGFDVRVDEHFGEMGILALQGPLASMTLEKLFPEISLVRHMHFVTREWNQKNVTISRTGYTGSDGFEIFSNQDVIEALWDELLEGGRSEGIEAVGLGARDTLRLEMGYALYGHELDSSIAPNESVSKWTIAWKKGDFLGKDALLKIEEDGKKRSQYGVILEDKGVAREGYAVFYHNEWIGKVTSGTFAPSLDQSIAVVMVEKALLLGEVVELEVRNQRLRGRIVALPFYQLRNVS